MKVKGKVKANNKNDVTTSALARFAAALMLASTLRSPRIYHAEPHFITTGSACSGWCSELFALDSLACQWMPVFACDSDPDVRKLIHAVHDHRFMFNDACKEDFLSAPYVECFMAGFPCQSFSIAGLNKGMQDEGGIVVLHVIKWIAARKPRAFLLENVKGLLVAHSAVLLLIISLLKTLKDNAGKPLYDVTWKCLDCRTHGGIPQHRERIFIVGVLTSTAKGEMRWPGKVPMQSLDKYIIECHNPSLAQFPGLMPSSRTEKTNLMNVLTKLQNDGNNPLESRYVIDINGSKPHYNEHYSPCLTRTRCGSGGFWLSWKQRKMDIHEILRLQGISQPSKLQTDAASTRQLGMIAGNAVPVTLLARVMKPLLEAAGLM